MSACWASERRDAYCARIDCARASASACDAAENCWAPVDCGGGVAGVGGEEIGVVASDAGAGAQAASGEIAVASAARRAKARRDMAAGAVGCGKRSRGARSQERGAGESCVDAAASAAASMGSLLMTNWQATELA